MWCCLHVTLKRSKILLTELVTLTVRVNEALTHQIYCRAFWSLVALDDTSLIKYEYIPFHVSVEKSSLISE